MKHRAVSRPIDLVEAAMFDRQPVLNASTAAGATSAILALLLAFGVDISKEQTTAILGFVGFAAPIISALVSRQWVTPLTDPRTSDGEILIPVPFSDA